MNPQKNEPHRPNWGWGVLLSVILFSLCFAAGYGLSLLIFSFTGRPADIWTHIITEILGLSVFALAVKIWVWLHTRRYSGNGRRNQLRNAFLDNTIKAMDRIAHGDFGVLLPVEEHDPFSGIAESVNKMAKELGSMENLRQDFISNVSHEIQSPLTSISGFAALLKNDALSPQQRAHYINVIETEAKRLSKLSDNLLKLSSLESSGHPLTRTSFSLDKQLQNSVLMLEPQWTEKNLELSLSLEKITYSGDRELLAQVWINLLHNAIKFTPEGGGISVTLTVTKGEAICCVSDTGTGFSEEDGMHIFERFYKADKARDRSLGGNGLGLSLVKKIIELHGGRITAKSQPDLGSTFTVTLPL
ncbi:MAG TPA: HAMP domain-containing histidine kinase [Clostridiales bacterium]|nr:HAMP domain-containing histidine kinase [Clostridiales bacterium]